MESQNLSKMAKVVFATGEWFVQKNLPDGDIELKNLSSMDTIQLSSNTVLKLIFSGVAKVFNNCAQAEMYIEKDNAKPLYPKQSIDSKILNQANPDKNRPDFPVRTKVVRRLEYVMDATRLGCSYECELLKACIAETHKRMGGKKPSMRQVLSWVHMYRQSEKNVYALAQIELPPTPQT